MWKICDILIFQSLKRESGHIENKIENPKVPTNPGGRLEYQGFFTIIVKKTYEFEEPYSIKHYSWLNLQSIQLFRTVFSPFS